MPCSNSKIPATSGVDFPLAWAEIDLGAVADNVHELRRVTQPSSMLMAVVKANGYGHGAVRIAETALKAGASWLGVANLTEAVSLRQAGIRAPILVFGYSFPESVPILVDFNLSQSVYSLDMAQEIASVAASIGKTVKIHIKIDTGMGRLGIPADQQMRPGSGQAMDPLEQIRAIATLEGLYVEGVFTHFAASDHRDKSYARVQFSRFIRLVEQIGGIGIVPEILHAANSAAVIDMPETHLDMVRAGISIYGLYPSPEVDRTKIVLKPALTLKTRVVHLKAVPRGFKISYGMTYETSHSTVIATVPIGYADGFCRKLSSCGHMLIRGERVPVVGRVCMDLVMLDVGQVPETAIGDEVVIVGCQGRGVISAEEIAARLDTIHYEVLTSISQRVNRIYIEGGF